TPTQAHPLERRGCRERPHARVCPGGQERSDARLGESGQQYERRGGRALAGELGENALRTEGGCRGAVAARLRHEARAVPPGEAVSPAGWNILTGRWITRRTSAGPSSSKARATGRRSRRWHGAVATTWSASASSLSPSGAHTRSAAC